MKDFNVGDIKNRDLSHVQARQTGKATPKKAQGSQEFIKTLESAVNQMQEASQSARVPGKKADASAIKQEVSNANENYVKMMKAGQLVSQLYHNMNSQKNEK